MSLDHITYHIEGGKLGDITADDDELGDFMKLIRFREIAVDDHFEHDWKVRWFLPVFSQPSWTPAIHFVETDEGEQDILSLGHFCVAVSEACMDQARASKWLTRDSGSGRVWLEYANLRVEVRPS